MREIDLSDKDLMVKLTRMQSEYTKIDFDLQRRILSIEVLPDRADQFPYKRMKEMHGGYTRVESKDAIELAEILYHYYSYIILEDVFALATSKWINHITKVTGLTKRQLDEIKPKFQIIEISPTDFFGKPKVIYSKSNGYIHFLDFHYRYEKYELTAMLLIFEKPAFTFTVYDYDITIKEEEENECRSDDKKDKKRNWTLWNRTSHREPRQIDS